MDRLSHPKQTEELQEVINVIKSKYPPWWIPPYNPPKKILYYAREAGTKERNTGCHATHYEPLLYFGGTVLSSAIALTADLVTELPSESSSPSPDVAERLFPNSTPMPIM